MKLCLTLAVILAAGTAYAQAPTTGAIQGGVVERTSKEPMAAVVITVRSPALIEPQTAITDSDGTFKISELPPGTYEIVFDAEDGSLTRTGVHVGANEV